MAHKSNAFIARFTRAILNHAPIGSYGRRFRVGDFEDTKCTCGREETREHILNGCIWTNCRQYTRSQNGREFDVDTLPGLIKFLEVNPHVFAFEEYPRDRQGVG